MRETKAQIIARLEKNLEVLRQANAALSNELTGAYTAIEKLQGTDSLEQVKEKVRAACPEQAELEQRHQSREPLIMTQAQRRAMTKAMWDAREADIAIGKKLIKWPTTYALRWAVAHEGYEIKPLPAYMTTAYLQGLIDKMDQS